MHTPTPSAAEFLYRGGSQPVELPPPANDYGDRLIALYPRRPSTEAPVELTLTCRFDAAYLDHCRRAGAVCTLHGFAAALITPPTLLAREPKHMTLIRLSPMVWATGYVQLLATAGSPGKLLDPLTTDYVSHCFRIPAPSHHAQPV